MFSIKLARMLILSLSLITGVTHANYNATIGGSLIPRPTDEAIAKLVDTACGEGGVVLSVQKQPMGSAPDCRIVRCLSSEGELHNVPILCSI
jgi:hypothetical protein